jgi:hypothetical protein
MGALGAPEGHQVDNRFVLGQKIRYRKQSVHHRKALEIWRIMVLFYKNRFTGSIDMKKTKKLGHFWQIRLFWQKIFELVYFGQNSSKFFTFF